MRYVILVFFLLVMTVAVQFAMIVVYERHTAKLLDLATQATTQAKDAQQSAQRALELFLDATSQHQASTTENNLESKR